MQNNNALVTAMHRNRYEILLGNETQYAKLKTSSDERKKKEDTESMTERLYFPCFFIFFTVGQ